MFQCVWQIIKTTAESCRRELAIVFHTRMKHVVNALSKIRMVQILFVHVVQIYNTPVLTKQLLFILNCQTLTKAYASMKYYAFHVHLKFNYMS